MRTIDADEILKKKYLENPYYRDYVVSVEAIENATTIEAEPVQHGKWIDMGDFVQCSQCGVACMKEFQSFYGKTKRVAFSRYCPSCGAKMDLEESE